MSTEAIPVEDAPEHIPTLAERLQGIIGVLHSQNGQGVSDASERAEEIYGEYLMQRYREGHI